MIDRAIQYIIEAINQDFDGDAPSTEPRVMPGNIAYIDAYQDTSFNRTSDKLIVSVVNIAQEGSLRNIPFRRSVTNDEGIPRTQERAPEIWLNVYVLFGANLNDYLDALTYISRIIGFFQRKYVFTPDELQALIGDTVAVDLPNVEKLIFDLYSMSFEELNQLWSIMGGKYIPSVMYKMRLAVIQEAEEFDSRPIEAIGDSPKGL